MIVKNPLFFDFEELEERGKIVAVSGYFDPPTPAHLKYFRAAKKLGDILVVILNTDKQLLRKREGTDLEGKIRYPFSDRAFILNEFRTVDLVVRSVDEGTAETIRVIKPHVFAKGGDRNLTNLPQEELDVCKEIVCKIVTGVGGEKTHSSSWYDWE